MKTITERDGKNVNMQVVGDLHKYPDGSVHTVKEGKAVWEEGSGSGGGVQDYSTTLVVEPDGSSATLYAFFDGLWLSEMEPNLEKGARIHITPTESMPMELYLYMTAKDGNTIYMATVISLGTEQTPRILLFRSEERVEGAYFTAKLSMG